MLSFSLKMMIADTKRIWHKAWWLALFFLVFMCVIPFIDNVKMSSFGYFIVAMLAFYRLQFSRIHYIVPFSLKQLKMLCFMHSAMLSGAMLVIGGLVVAICRRTGMSWNRGGFLMLAFYITLIVMFSSEAFGEKSHTFQARHVGVIIIAMASLIIAFGAFLEWLPYIYNLLLAGGCVVAAIIYAIYSLHKVEMGDFIYVPAGIWDDGKIERK